MFRELFAATSICLASLGASGAEFAIKIISHPNKVPQGAPISILVEVRNISGHPITVARGYGGFEYVLSVRRADGLPRKGCKQPATGAYIPGFTGEVLPADWQQVRTEDITCDDIPGVWLVQARISCQGTYPVYQSGRQTGQIDAWNGTVNSEEVHIEIAAPTGLDKTVYEKTNKCPMCDPAQLLKDFPASTYAVYALAQHYGLKGETIPLDTARTRAYLAELQKNGAETLKDKTRHFACGPDGNELHDAKGDHIPITVEQYLRDSIAQAESICSRHPGLGLCDQIRFNVIAYDYMELLQFQDAASAFRSLQQETTDQQLRENCGKMLEVLKEMGLDGRGDSKEPAAPAKDK